MAGTISFRHAKFATVFAAVSFGLLMVLSSRSCSADNLAKSLKGWELYSWKDGKNWKFSFFVGTNRLKSDSEIKHAPLSETQLEAKIKQLAPVETVTWIAKAYTEEQQKKLKLCYPPDETVERIAQLCKKREVILQYQPSRQPAK